MEEILYLFLGAKASLLTLGFIYYRKHPEELREVLVPFPNKPILDEERYVGKQIEIYKEYEKSLESRINDKIF